MQFIGLILYFGCQYFFIGIFLSDQMVSNGMKVFLKHVVKETKRPQQFWEVPSSLGRKT